MSHVSPSSLVTIALPVYNGADSVAQVIESVLGQDYPHFELVISDNASTDGTGDICRHFARSDRRVVYQRHATNIGLLNNFRSAAEIGTGSYLRWIGDSDSLDPSYLSRTLEVFAEDERRVLVTTQITYVDDDGVTTPPHNYDPSALASADPVERFTEMLRLLTSGFAMLDPLYGVMRRSLTILPRRNILREDEVFAVRLAFAGPWGHVPAPLARRHRSEVAAKGLVSLLGVPTWHRHVTDMLQCRDLLTWIADSSLDPAQRRRARAAVVRMYARRKKNKIQRGIRKVHALISPAEQASLRGT